MPLLVAFALLLAAAVWLGAEVATGRTKPRTRFGAWAGAAVFACAASAGGTLLVALPWAEWVLIVALLPLTFICIVRFVVLLQSRVSGWRSAVLAGVVLAAGVIAGIQTVPIPLTRAEIQSALPGAPAPSAHPNAGRLVRT